MLFAEVMCFITVVNALEFAVDSVPFSELGYLLNRTFLLILCCSVSLEIRRVNSRSQQ